MENITTRLIGREFALKVIAGIRENIDNIDPTGFGPMNNTGEAKNSLGYEWDGDNRLVIFSDMPGREFNYIMTLETGRKPGKMPPPDEIEVWIKQRGIQVPGFTDSGLAFVMARRIGAEGSAIHRKGGKSGIISQYTDSKFIEENLTEKLAEALIKDMTEQLLAA